jgi:hypothetical protein
MTHKLVRIKLDGTPDSIIGSPFRAFCDCLDALEREIRGVIEQIRKIDDQLDSNDLRKGRSIIILHTGSEFDTRQYFAVRLMLSESSPTDRIEYGLSIASDDCDRLSADTLFNNMKKVADKYNIVMEQ